MFQYFLIDLAFFFLRFVVGMSFIVYGFNRLQNREKRKEFFGPGNAWLAYVIGVLKIVGGLMLVTGILVKIAGAVLLGISLEMLFFEVFIWREDFASGWDKTLFLIAISLLFLLAGGGNWILII